MIYFLGEVHDVIARVGELILELIEGRLALECLQSLLGEVVQEDRTESREHGDVRSGRQRGKASRMTKIPEDNVTWLVGLAGALRPASA